VKFSSSKNVEVRCFTRLAHLAQPNRWNFTVAMLRVAVISAKKTQAPTPQAQIRNRQTRKVANAKDLNRNTNLA